MTREEATEAIKFGHCEDMYYRKEYEEAVDKAIKALEQEPILDKIRAEIEEWYWQTDKQALTKDPCIVDTMVDLFIRMIDKYQVQGR